MTKNTDLHNKWMQDETYQEAYDALEDEFALAAATHRGAVTGGIGAR